MARISDRHDGSELRALVSRQTISRRDLLSSLVAGAAGLAVGAQLSPALAAQSVTSLTYSGQRWGAVQEAMAHAFSQSTGIEARIITFPISQGYARILNAMGTGSKEYDVVELDYGILAQVADKLTPLDDFLAKDPAYAKDYQQAVSANVRALY
jgi:ABC-type glycerol-3-phosphate transport system substrate-binding protein